MPRTDQIRSESVQDILTRVPHWTIIWGNTIVFIMLLMFLSFGWFIKYPDVITAKAIVTTAIPPQKEYTKTSGKLQHILVSSEQQVVSGQNLAVLETTADYQDIQYLKTILDTLQYTRQHFDFPINQIPILFLGEVEAPYATFENNYLQYDQNRYYRPFKNKRSSIHATERELTTRLKTLKNQKELQKRELSFQKIILDRNQILFEKGVISLQEYEQQQLQYLQAERSYTTINASISQIRETMATSQNSYKMDEFNNNSEEIRLLRNTIQSFKQLKKAIYDWELRYVLKATINGKVFFLNSWSENQEVKEGDLIFTILPSKSQNYLARLEVPAPNSGKLANNQLVYIKLDNYPETEFGKLESNINYISSVPDEEGNYLVDSKLPKRLITNYQREISFKSEMSGTAEIVTEDLRLIERLFYRLRSIFNS